MVDDVKLAWSTQNTSAPLPICTFSTKICESDPNGRMVMPVVPQLLVPVPLNFWPETPLVNWFESSSVQNMKVSSVLARYEAEGETRTFTTLVEPTEPLCGKASL